MKVESRAEVTSTASMSGLYRFHELPRYTISYHTYMRVSNYRQLLAEAPMFLAEMKYTCGSPSGANHLFLFSFELLKCSMFPCVTHPPRFPRFLSPQFAL